MVSRTNNRWLQSFDREGVRKGDEADSGGGCSARGGGVTAEDPTFIYSVLESLPYPFYVIDAETYALRYANSAASTESLEPGVRCHGLAHGRDRPCGTKDHPCPAEAVKRTGKPTSAEHVHEDRYGRPRNVEVHAFPIFDQNGSVSSVIEYAVDVTERKRGEREREKLIARLQEALTELKTLHGLIPICASCKKIRDDGGYWKQVEQYVQERTHAEFTHGLCPECAEAFLAKRDTVRR